MKKRTMTALLVFVYCMVYAQKTDKQLQQQIGDLVKGFNGTVGVMVIDLKHNRVAAFNADTIFPTASIVKIPILVGVMDKIEKGELHYHQRVTYTDSLFYDEGDDILASFKAGATIELSKVMMLMLTTSDNTASLWLQGLCGGGKHINALLDSAGFKHTRVNSRTPGREQARAEYGWGQSTPAEMAQLMRRIVDGKMLGSASSDRMLRLLGRQYWDEEALSQVPPGVFTADKNGAVDASRDEVVYVNGPETPYLFSIFTKQNKDTSWEYNNEAWVLTRKLSALLWKYFNPGHPYNGAPFSK